RRADHARRADRPEPARRLDQQRPRGVRGAGTRDIAGRDTPQLASDVRVGAGPATAGHYDCRAWRPPSGGPEGRGMTNAGADIAPAALAGTRRASTLGDYLELTIPRLNLLVVVTSAGGFYLASPGGPSLAGMAAASIGTALVAGGAAVLNQV